MNYIVLDFLNIMESIPQLPPLIDIEEGMVPLIGAEPQEIEYDNIIQDIMVGWEYVDKKYIEQEALVLYSRIFHCAKFDGSEQLTAQVLRDLEHQENNPTVFLDSICCSDHNCKNNVFLQCVLQACRLVFEKTEFF